MTHVLTYATAVHKVTRVQVSAEGSHISSQCQSLFTNLASSCVIKV